LESGNPMTPSGKTERDIAETLRQLRLVMTGLRGTGIEDWAAAWSDPAVGLPEPEKAIEQESDPARGLTVIAGELEGCRRCRLHSERTRIVFGEGSAHAPLVFVGEGPGLEEDRQGRPFVGRAGRLLDQMIKALGFRREAVYICNVVKCRPPKNRTPESEEIAVCGPFLIRQIEAIRPRVICALGACAAQTLVGTGSSISRLRGSVHYWRGIPLICTFHPAYLLRTPAQKAAAWEDLILVRDILRTGCVQDGGIGREGIKSSPASDRHTGP